jgi:hypothetical protein
MYIIEFPWISLYMSVCTCIVLPERKCIYILILQFSFLCTMYKHRHIMYLVK